MGLGDTLDSLFNSSRLYCLFLTLCYVVCEILVPRLGIEPVAPVVEAEQSPNHWTTWEFPPLSLNVIILK